MTIRYLLLFVIFTQNEVCGTRLVFSKEEISRFRIGNFKNVQSLLRKVHLFSTPLGQRNFQQFQTFCVYSCSPSHKLSRTILNYTSKSDIREVVKFIIKVTKVLLNTV